MITTAKELWEALNKDKDIRYMDNLSEKWIVTEDRGRLYDLDWLAEQLHKGTDKIIPPLLSENWSVDMNVLMLKDTLYNLHLLDTLADYFHNREFVETSPVNGKSGKAATNRVFSLQMRKLQTLSGNRYPAQFIPIQPVPLSHLARGASIKFDILISEIIPANSPGIQAATRSGTLAIRVSTERADWDNSCSSTGLSNKSLFDPRIDFSIDVFDQAGNSHKIDYFAAFNMRSTDCTGTRLSSEMQARILKIANVLF